MDTTPFGPRHNGSMCPTDNHTYRTPFVFIKQARDRDAENVGQTHQRGEVRVARPVLHRDDGTFDNPSAPLGQDRSWTRSSSSTQPEGSDKIHEVSAAGFALTPYDTG